jgi:Arc/MetJ-type ribon-helix-helix transcriptional regulator
VTKQIAIRISTELVEFVDSLVAQGEASSRAAVVTRALAHEQRRIKALKDVAILSCSQVADKFDELAAFVANQPIDLD